MLKELELLTLIFQPKLSTGWHSKLNPSHLQSVWFRQRNPSFSLQLFQSSKVYPGESCGQAKSKNLEFNLLSWRDSSPLIPDFLKLSYLQKLQQPQLLNLCNLNLCSLNLYREKKWKITLMQKLATRCCTALKICFVYTFDVWTPFTWEAY